MTLLSNLHHEESINAVTNGCRIQMKLDTAQLTHSKNKDFIVAVKRPLKKRISGRKIKNTLLRNKFTRWILRHHRGFKKKQIHPYMSRVTFTESCNFKYLLFSKSGLSQKLVHNSFAFSAKTNFFINSKFRRFLIARCKRIRDKKFKISRLWVIFGVKTFFFKKGQNQRMGKGIGSFSSTRRLVKSGRSVCTVSSPSRKLFKKISPYIRSRVPGKLICSLLSATLTSRFDKNLNTPTSLSFFSSRFATLWRQPSQLKKIHGFLKLRFLKFNRRKKPKKKFVFTKAVKLAKKAKLRFKKKLCKKFFRKTLKFSPITLFAKLRATKRMSRIIATHRRAIRNKKVRNIFNNYSETIYQTHTSHFWIAVQQWSDAYNIKLTKLTKKRTKKFRKVKKLSSTGIRWQ